MVSASGYFSAVSPRASFTTAAWSRSESGGVSVGAGAGARAGAGGTAAGACAVAGACASDARGAISVPKAATVAARRTAAWFIFMWRFPVC